MRSVRQEKVMSCFRVTCNGRSRLQDLLIARSRRKEREAKVSRPMVKQRRQ